MTAQDPDNYQQVNLVLTLADVNAVLTALGEQPYRQVHQLVANIRAQAERQLVAMEVPEEPQ